MNSREKWSKLPNSHGKHRSSLSISIERLSSDRTLRWSLKYNYLWRKSFQSATISTRRCLINLNSWCFTFRVSPVDLNYMNIPNMPMTCSRTSRLSHRVERLIHSYRLSLRVLYRRTSHRSFNRLCRPEHHFLQHERFSRQINTFVSLFLLIGFIHVGQRRRIWNFSFFGTRLRMRRPS